MKISVLLIIAGGLVLTLSVGAGLAWLDQQSVPTVTEPAEIEVPDDLHFAPEDGPQPVADVDEASHDFGEMTPETDGEHTFVVRNSGKFTLHLKEGPTDCRCMVSEADDVTEGSESERGKWSKKVPPGGSTNVTLKWTTTKTPQVFRKQATIWTNDRLSPRVELTIYGTIRPRVEARPGAVNVIQMLSDETVIKEVQVLAAYFEHLQIVDYRLEEMPSAEFLQVHHEPIPPEQIPIGFASGERVTVTLKPGLPYGALTQTIRITTNVPEQSVLEIPVYAEVKRDITVAGGGYNARSGVLTLGVVDSAEGMKRSLMLLVRGPHREDVTFTPPVTEPDCLRVELGEPTPLNDSVTQVPMTVEIPPGAAPVSRLGLEQGKLGEITIETTHPRIPEVQIPVKFAVER